MTENTAVSNWQLERKNWTSFYEHQLQRQLQQAIIYIRTNNHQLTQLKQHFESYIVLLRRARTRKDLHPVYIEMLTALHPLPLRWGKWNVWEEELQCALPILTTLGQKSKLAKFMTYLSDIQLQTGHLELALHTSQAALNLAWSSQSVVSWSMAGGQTVLLLSRLGKNDQARHTLTKLEKQWAKINPVASPVKRLEAAGHLLLQRMPFLRHDGHPMEAANHAQALIEQLTALPHADYHLLATLYKDQATMFWAADQYEHAEKALKKAIAIYAEIGDVYSQMAARGNLGLVYWSMARLNEAEAGIRQSLKSAETLNARWRVMSDIGNLCAVYFYQGKLSKALQYTHRHLKIATEVDDAAEMDRALGNRAVARLCLGQYAAALPDVEQTLVQLQALGLWQQLAKAYLHQSCCFYGLGRKTEGKTAVSTAANLAANIDSPSLQGLLLRCQALFTNQTDAVNLVQQALALAQQYQQRIDEAQCLLRLSVLTTGSQREDFWAEGTALMHEIGAEVWINGYTPDRPPTIALIL